MILRNIYFPPALGASGVQGFFGNPNYPEYKHSLYVKAMYGDIFQNMGFVAKTATVDRNKGNVILDKNGYSFSEFLPDAIYPMPLKNAALNAVALSNPGFEFLLKQRIWQQRTGSFMLSYMPIRETAEARLEETHEFVELFLKYQKQFQAKIGLQVNISCPSTQHKQSELLREVTPMLSVLGKLGIPLIPKINATLPVEIAQDILSNSECDALCCSNTIPFGELPDQINWHKYGNRRRGEFRETSPLQRHGYAAGGLSGAPIFPIVVDWLKKFEAVDRTNKPILACGGVSTPDNVKALASFINVGAVCIGTSAFNRPWRVKNIIKQCYKELCDD